MYNILMDYFYSYPTGAFHCDGLRASDVLPILREKIAYCSGNKTSVGVVVVVVVVVVVGWGGGGGGGNKFEQCAPLLYSVSWILSWAVLLSKSIRPAW